MPEPDDQVGAATAESGAGPLSFFKEAFKLQYNLIGLGTAAAFALLSVSGLPLVLAAGLELIYLSTVPNMPRFQRLVRSWKYEEEKRQREVKLVDMLRELPRELQARYGDLCGICAAIRGNYNRLSSTSRIFTGQLDQKLNGLAHSYLRLLYASKQHREYLRSTDPAVIRREVAELQHGLDADPPKVQEINRKRIEIMGKRLEKYEKIKENLDVIDAQCAAIEDVLHLMRDQSVTFRDPQQMAEQLESLMQDVEQTEQTVREVESIFDAVAPDDLQLTAGPGGLPASPPSRAPQGSPRQRLRNGG